MRLLRGKQVSIGAISRIESGKKCRLAMLLSEHSKKPNMIFLSLKRELYVSFKFKKRSCGILPATTITNSLSINGLRQCFFLLCPICFSLKALRINSFSTENGNWRFFGCQTKVFWQKSSLFLSGWRTASFTRFELKIAVFDVKDGF